MCVILGQPDLTVWAPGWHVLAMECHAVKTTSAQTPCGRTGPPRVKEPNPGTGVTECQSRHSLPLLKWRNLTKKSE